MAGTASFVDLLAARTGRALDLAYAKLVHNLGITGPFFAKGWGDLNVVDFASDMETLASWPPPHFDVQITWTKLQSGMAQGVPYEKLQGEFRTPCVGKLYDALPAESRVARVQLLLPKLPLHQLSCMVHLAGTGDHGFDRRLGLGWPLLKEGIASIALESPYYGARRPPQQRGSKLARVSDLLALGRATIEESLLLMHWASGEGIAKLGVSGFSMGGVHASMVASLYPGECAVAPLLAPRSAAIAFCQGVLRSATAWAPLTKHQDERQQHVQDAVRTAISALAMIQSGAILRAESLQQLQSTSSLLAGLLPDVQAVPHTRTEQARHAVATRPQQGVARPFAAVPAARGIPTATLPVAAAAAAAPAWHGADAACGGASASGTHLHSGGDWVAAATGRAVSGSALDAHVAALASGSGSNGADACALLWLTQVLEAYTDVTRYPRPSRPDAAVIVGATDDAYVDPASIAELHNYWAGSEVRWVPGGHVSAYLLHRAQFRAAIRDSLARL